MRFKNIAVYFIVLSFFATGCSAPVAEEVPPPTAVEVSSVKLTSIQNEIAFAGQIKPYSSVSIVSKMSGKVKESFFEVGDSVNEGDVLFTLDEEDINNQIRELNASLNQAEQGVATAQSGLSKVTGGQYEAQVSQQQTGIETYQKQVDSAKNALSNAEVAISNVEVTIDNARVSVNSAKVTLDSAQTSIDNAQVAIDNAQVAIDNNQDIVNTNKKNFDNAVIMYAAGAISKKEYDSLEAAYNQSSTLLAQSKNGLISAKNAYAQARNSYAQAKNGLASAENAYTQAKNGYKTTNNAYEQARNGVEQAEISLQQAQKTLGLTEGQIVNENKLTAELGVASAQSGADVIKAKLETAESTLKNTAVTAPQSGIISFKGINANEYTSQQSPAYTIIDSNVVKVNVKVSELIINALAVGDETSVYIHSLQEEPFIGIIKTISPAADQTNTYPVTIEIANNDGKIKSGMFAEVYLILEKSDNTIVLPINAVLRSDKEQYVYINDNGVAKRVTVTTGITDGREIEIVTGLSEADQVIVTGQSYVSNDQPINVISADGNNMAGEE